MFDAILGGGLFFFFIVVIWLIVGLLRCIFMPFVRMPRAYYFNRAD